MIDEAVTLGRLAMRASARERRIADSRDWGVPVLYLRAGGGPIFNPIGDDAVRHEAERKISHLVEQQVTQVEASGRLIGAIIGSMTEELLTIRQKADESVDGLMLGGAFISVQAGQLTIEQRAGTVRGAMVGLQVDSLGAGLAPPAGAAAAVRELERRLGVERYGAASPRTHCQHCGVEVGATDRFCSRCGGSLS